MAGFKALARRVTTQRAASKDLAAARVIDISTVRSVCLFLGPYRNLTTLTASVLFLHPHCQVLNHAGRSVFGNRRIDFLDRYDEATFDDFVRYAIHASAGGQRGSVGGSITHSHAFGDDYDTRKIFEATGVELVKPDIRSLVWKESLATSNHIRHNQVDVDAIFDRDERLRFLMPIRHPVDTAVSTVEKGFAKHFDGPDDDAPLERVIDAILDEFVWFEGLRARRPERFFVFYEHSAGHAMLKSLATFLDLEPLDAWLDPATRAFEVKSRYDHPAELIEYYRRAVTQRFAEQPELEAELLRFTPR